MITSYAKLLRNEIDRQPLDATAEQSDKLFDELLDNCNPTTMEFADIAHRLMITSYGLYRLFVDGFRLKK
jgi:hypothetical protein